ncbi:Aste57867_21985 [Aphanomyces stellatus]|uniref:Aste57867_21985 protein n=1 Tax=Aphanomyces stellatus TaxID=120398 RepID=A0A485LJN9_9STRA|nr:hypothetical protein As57867_021916 [Aphanomyces stellatus]VFT98653.1 Aste57867_21985 [Aphanomyces stellatus]
MSTDATNLSLLHKKNIPAPVQSWALSSAIPTKPVDATTTVLPFAALRTHHLGQHVLYADSLPSTQTLLQKVAVELRAVDGAPDFRLVAYTPKQEGGKGRGTNTWVSPAGCLTFSFQSVLTDGASLPFAQYLVSLAIVRTAKAFAASNVYIKWPNDLYADNKKLGGILCQSEFFQGQFILTTGIGLNISNAEPTLCLNQLLPTPITTEQFLVEFCNQYEPMEAQFKADGFAPFVDEYTANWLHSNQVVQVQSDVPGESAMRATIQGMTWRYEDEAN